MGNLKRKGLTALTLALAVLAVPGPAAAAIDTTAVETAFADIQTTGMDIFGYALPVIAAIVATLVAVKLFKRFAKSV